jgi:hypothetical protein
MDSDGQSSRVTRGASGIACGKDTLRFFGHPNEINRLEAGGSKNINETAFTSTQYLSTSRYTGSLDNHRFLVENFA